MHNKYNNYYYCGFFTCTSNMCLQDTCIHMYSIPMIALWCTTLIIYSPYFLKDLVEL